MKDVEGVKTLQKGQLNFLYALIAVAYIPMLFLGLTDYDEGAFASTSLQMIKDNQFFIPYLGEELRLEKPIFAYWVQALSIYTFGANEFALRFPSMLAAIIWAISFGKFIQDNSHNIRLWNQALTLLLLPGFFLISFVATADAFLNLFITLALLAIYSYVKNQKQNHLNNAAIFISIGFLIKGFAILAITGPIFLIYCFITKNIKLFFKAALSGSAWIRFLIIVCPWFLILYLRTDLESLQYLLFGQSFGRFSDVMESHTGSYFYYFLVLPFLVLPFFGNVLSEFKSIFKVRNDTEKFMIVWFFWVFLLFSFSSTKLPHYLIYGLTPLAYFIEKSFQNSARASYKIFSAIYDLSCVIFLFLIPYLAIYLFELNPTFDISIEFLKNYVEKWVPSTFLLLLGITLITQMAMKKKYVFVKKFFAASFLIYVSVFLLPVIIQSTQKDLKVLSEYIQKNNLPLVVYKINKPTISFYSEKTYIRDNLNSPYLLTRKDKLGSLINEFEIIKESGNYLIVLQKGEKN